MRRNCIQSKNAKSLLLVIGFECQDFCPLRRSHLAWLLLCPQNLFTLRNIHGACREKVTSIASMKHRSNVSGQHRASAAVL